MFLKYPIICSHVYCYSNKSLTHQISKILVGDSKSELKCRTIVKIGFKSLSACVITILISMTMLCETDNIPQSIPKYFPNSV